MARPCHQKEPIYGPSLPPKGTENGLSLATRETYLAFCPIWLFPCRQKEKQPKSKQGFGARGSAAQFFPDDPITLLKKIAPKSRCQVK